MFIDATDFLIKNYPKEQHDAHRKSHSRKGNRGRGKRRKQGSEVVTKRNQLKMRATDRAREGERNADRLIH